MQHFKILTFLFLLPALFSSNTEAQEAIFARHPALSPDGKQVAFSYQGDLWVGPSNGGMAQRLTIHEGMENSPVWSPDGKHIAFASDRFGNDDVFVISPEGKNLKRLTYHTANDVPFGFTPEGEVIFQTYRNFMHLEREREIHRISVGGGTPTRILDAVAMEPAMSADGRFLAFVRGTCRPERYAYTGPANRDIWVYDTKNDKYHQITTFNGQDTQPDFGPDGQLYFLSSRTGQYNVHRVKLNEDGSKNGTPEAVTNFKEDGLRDFDLSKDGSALVFEQNTSILLQKNAAGAKAEALKFSAPDDFRFDPVEHKVFTSKVENFDVSPNGKYIAFAVRGEIFITENDKEKSRTVRITNHAYRDREPTWLNDSTLLFISDRFGQYDLFMARSAKADEPALFRSLKHEIVRLTETEEDEQNLSVAPNDSLFTFQRGRGDLILSTMKGSKVQEIRTLLSGWNAASSVSFSPDSRWIAYGQEDLNFNEEVFVLSLDEGSKPVNVSMHPRSDGNPVWSADGTKLGFTSNRNNGDNDVWFAWLRKADWLKTKADWELEKENQEAEAKKKKDGDAPEPIQIDTDGLYMRLAQVTSMPGGEYNLNISKDGETFYFTGQDGDKRNLYSAKWDGSELKPLTRGGSPYGLRMGRDFKMLYGVQYGSLKAVALSGDVEPRPFKARMAIYHDKERVQLFEETWRALDQNFYDPKFHGKNWDKLKQKYKPMALKATTAEDFRLITNQMLGELNASHMGLYGGNRAETQRERTGLLGIRIVPEKGGIRVKEVIANTPADRPESQLLEGDLIVSVNQNSVSLTENFYAPFVNTADERVILQVRGKDGKEREVIIRPTRSVSDALYEEWVTSRKALTEKYSKGRLGYIHIEGMNWPSFERFERELMAAGHGKDGLVIDVRWNGGGWTTDYLMAVLNVRQHAYTVPRGAAPDPNKERSAFREYYPYGERLPFGAWTKGAVALCNANSYSNAEIFSHAFKELGHGKLVGVQTFGAVISTGGMGLMDGSFVRLPFRGWYVKNTDANMENEGAMPDVVLENAPDSKAKGRDEQLQKAVEVLLEELK